MSTLPIIAAVLVTLPLALMSMLVIGALCVGRLASFFQGAPRVGASVRRGNPREMCRAGLRVSRA